jgi:hypothetical protein
MESLLRLHCSSRGVSPLSCSRGRDAGSLCRVCIVEDFLSADFFSGFAAAGGKRASGYLGVIWRWMRGFWS